MRRKSLVRNVVGVALFLAIPIVSWGADDGAALYKSKCAHCHGAGGEGKPSAKAPALKGTALDADKITQQITKGAPGSKSVHKKAMSSVTEEQAKAIAEYVKTLK